MHSAPYFAGDCVDARYTIRREVARGGTCVVYEAEHVHLHARVILKSLNEAAAGVRGLDARLLREGQALWASRHPGVARVLDGGVDGDGRSYLVLEQIEGRSLDGVLAARGRLEPATAVEILAQLTEALAHVHACGVVHRDVKPSNIMVAWDAAGAERLVLIDFGIASLGDTAPGAPKLTQRGDQIGTYEYMPPEQLFHDPVDGRADVYAAGATLYELLSGDIPYPGGYAAAVEAILAGRPPASLESVLGEHGRAFDTIVRRALSRRPDDRYPSAAALGREVCAVLGGARRPLQLLGRRTEAEPATPRPGAEGRRHLRAPYVTPARVVYESGAHVDGRSEDISEGGLLLIVRDAPPEGVDVKVRFSLPLSGQLVTLPARARWAKSARMQVALGIEFVDLGIPEAADIRAFVAAMGA